ncbi:MAG: response regulator [Burkholderiaceae bacterium]
MRWLLRSLALAALAIATLLPATWAHAQIRPMAREGVLEWPAGQEGPLLLEGEWGFAWHEFTDPAQARPNTAFARVPSSWTDLPDPGKTLRGEGFATYTLEVRCPAGREVALSMPAQRSAVHVYVNGRLAATQGRPGATEQEALPAVRGRTVLTGGFTCPLRITAHVSNFSHRAGGMVRAPLAGSRLEMERDRMVRLGFNSALLGAYLVMGSLSLLFFATRRKDRTPLYFGLFCFAIAVYADMTGERGLLLMFTPEVDWEVYLRTEYFAWFGSMAMFVLVVASLFAGEMRRGAVWALLAATAFGAAVTLVTTARTYSHIVPYGQALSLVFGLYVTWAASSAARRKKEGANILLGGMGCVLLVLMVDVAQYNAGYTLRSVTPLGMLALVLAPGIVMARRLARALNVEELRGLEQRVRGDLLVRTTKAGIFDWDTTLGRMHYSVRLREMLGHAPDADTVNWGLFHAFVHEEDRPQVVADFETWMRGRQVRSGESRHAPSEFRLVRADGSHLWVMAEAISLTGSDGRALRFICSFLDVTERREMEEGLKASLRLREDVERMARHDLKTPLNSIIGATRLLSSRQGTASSSTRRELLGVIERASYRMLEMVNLSLDLFRMERGSYDFRPQAVDLGEIVVRVIVDSQPLAQAQRVEVRFDRVEGWRSYVRAEELLCYSIVANVLKNAIEATPPGGEVVVSLEAGDPVMLRIGNPGHLPPDVAERFFDKYFSTGKSGGTGLGTYSARLMARIQEGDLILEAGHHGVTLVLALPALARESLSAPAPLSGASQPGELLPEPLGEADFGIRTIPALVVDDDDYNRLIVRHCLPSPPFAVETAANGRAAIERFTARRPALLLIDMEMPLMNGLEATAWIRAHEAAEEASGKGEGRCVIVMLSSNDDDASIARAWQAGIDHYLVKPVTKEVLLGTLARLLGGGSAGNEGGLKELVAQDAAADGEAEAGEDDAVAIDPALAAEVPAFVDSRRALVREMAEALRHGDREELAVLAHRAGGGLSLFGFAWAAAQCRRIEEGASTLPDEELDALLATLGKHLDHTRWA